ncbi:MAG TPA: C25 family cysteine peptidase [Burkholderiaceae bacterium]|nr:C25 family cysteine peptidase [Burkholderiaceae bacterium]
MASIKLSITHRATLVRKYAPAALAKIDKAVADWVAADKARGITTVHVALDDAPAMRKLGVPAVAGKLTPLRAKRALDALARGLAPDYIVLFGGHDVVPNFVVPNPSLDAATGDDDPDVPTDNPYACSRAYRARARESYLVPDRVVGRVPDVPCADGQGDAAWLVAALRTATAWTPRAREFYADAYATCCDAWRKAGEATVRYLGIPLADLMIAPPEIDGAALSRRRLARPLHVTKCHGALLDARYSGQKGRSFPDILSSASLRAHAKPATLAAAMCCYGAQVFAPDDPRNNTPGQWPIALAYLRGGAPGFMGATRIAWVGVSAMMCADWIVAGYLKKCLEGASLGRAMLESKQDYLQFLQGQGQRPDTADEKTMIEFVLLGDPSIHPVKSAATPMRTPATRGTAAAARGGVELQRAERRAARRELGAAVTRRLPVRSAAPAPAAAKARQLYAAALRWLGTKGVPGLAGVAPSVSRLSERHATAPARAAAGKARSAVAAGAVPSVAGKTTEYRWTRVTRVNGVPEGQMLTMQVDAEGRILRSRLLAC